MAKFIEVTQMLNYKRAASSKTEFINVDYIVKYYEPDDDELKFWGRTVTAIQIDKGDKVCEIIVKEPVDTIKKRINK